MSERVDSAGRIVTLVHSEERFIFLTAPLLAPGGSPWNILPYKIFVYLRPEAMQYQFDQLMYANNVIYDERLFLPWVA